jgi:hypothetical protein
MINEAIKFDRVALAAKIDAGKFKQIRAKIQLIISS